MFELKYKITDADMEKINKGIMWKYFIPYILVALAGIVVGIIATVFRPSVSITVLGIILLVLGTILAVCAVLLAILPKSFVMSVIIPDGSLERTVKFDDNGITVSTDDQSDITFGYGEVTNVKTNDLGLLLYFGSNRVLPVLSEDKALVADIAAAVCLVKTKKPTETAAVDTVSEAQSAPAENAGGAAEEGGEGPHEETPADGSAE